jgi:hypothetical protein
MKTYKVKFNGDDGLALVTADDMDDAIELVQKELTRIGLRQPITPKQMTQVLTEHRHVDILRSV